MNEPTHEVSMDTSNYWITLRCEGFTPLHFYVLAAPQLDTDEEATALLEHALRLLGGNGLGDVVDKWSSAIASPDQHVHTCFRPVGPVYRGIVVELGRQQLGNHFSSHMP